MTTEFDDNGKFFTDIISKTPFPVLIQTAIHRIHGNIHIGQGRRLKDELDLPEKFIAVTEASISLPDGQVLYQANFLAVRRDEILWVMPDNEIADLTNGSAK
ncbi:MAG TPA: hypothetical protein VF359_01915 [Anaerolineales bacterium]